MAVPFIQQARVGAYIIKQKIMGVKRYPLVLMLEPLFKCNLACPGCGKIDYPKPILDKRLTVQECLDAVDECGAPIVSIPGGEPLIHKDMQQIVEGIIARKKFVYLCTNALLLKKRMKDYSPSPYLTFSIHLDGLEEEHDKAVNQEGTFKIAVEAIKMAVEKGFRVTINSTLFNNATPEAAGRFFDFAMTMGVESITISPGYAYERAEGQESFLKRTQTKNLFRDIFRANKKNGGKWIFNQSTLFLDFLAGNQRYQCTPWGNATRNIFGWQKPCYLISEGYAKTFREMMEDTDWDAYGTGRYEKCADCMVHSGFEPTAVNDTVAHPLKALKVFLKGIDTEGPMVEDFDLSNQRPADDVYEQLVTEVTAEVTKEDTKAEQQEAV